MTDSPSHSPQAILITQCLQNDFVKPLGRYDPLPNRLHVGFEEARRLLGENPSEGPLALAMRWAYERPAKDLKIIHITDCHDPSDPQQAEHFRQFGSHCVVGAEGAQFAFPAPQDSRPVDLVPSPGLNDFVGTRLAEVLAPFVGTTMRVGLIGVWTEAKVSFLAYDLRSRYPSFEISVCSALTASSSRAHHFMALDQMRRLLGITVHASVGEFIQFLGGSSFEIPLSVPKHADSPQLVFQGDRSIAETDQDLVRYLFRDCREVRLKILDGGFSGNVVLGSESIDCHGRRQAQHVVKIGPEGLIGKEREAFENVEGVMGNNAPRIAEFADLNGRGGLKYRYAAMGAGFSTTFQKLYMSGLSAEKTERFLREVFVEQLGRFYSAATLERCNLLEYYEFSSKWSSSVRSKVEALIPGSSEGPRLRIPGGPEVANVCRFYEEDLDRLLPMAQGASTLATVHGDLNGANIIIDAHENVWLIDFFHTHRGHILRDLIKLENDLLYIFTPVCDPPALCDAFRFTDRLLDIEDLGAPLPEVDQTGLTDPVWRRAYETIRVLRSFYPALIGQDRNALQLLIGQLRYAVHTLSFDEPNTAQKIWALYTACLCAAKIVEKLKATGPLRVDWLSLGRTQPGRLGLTILPGRKDTGRDLEQDLNSLKAQGVTHVGCLLGDDELHRYGVDGLDQAYREAGIALQRVPTLDQKVPSGAEMRAFCQWLNDSLARGAHIAIHCVGGLGRSGVAASCCLVSRGCTADEAIAEVRSARSPRAIETEVQEQFIREFERKR